MFTLESSLKHQLSIKHKKSEACEVCDKFDVFTDCKKNLVPFINFSFNNHSHHYSFMLK